MGFYGSVYYQITNAFAKILINNIGKNNKLFPDPESIKTNDIALEADGRNGTASFSSGNRWIQMVANGTDNSCQLYHAPADENANSFVIPFQKVDFPTPAMLENAEPLDGGSCFETPVIYYDDAGHLVSSGYTKYFTIPKSDYEQSLETIQQDIVDLQESESKQNTDIQINKNNINTHNTSIQNLNNTTTDIQTFIGNKKTYSDATGYTTLTQGIQDIQQQGLENATSFQNLYNDFAELKERVRILEAKG